MQNNETLKKAIAVSTAILFFLIIFGQQLFPAEITGLFLLTNLKFTIIL